KELPRDRPVSVGRTEAHVVLRAGAWTLFLEIQEGVRFPRLDEVAPDARSAATRLRLDGEDAAFLVQALDRLPGADEPYNPATLDCNGKVAIRAQGSEQARATELVLGRSHYTGAPVRLNTDRTFLSRAVRLGFREIAIVDAREPVVCRDGSRVYCWQPLSHE